MLMNQSLCDSEGITHNCVQAATCVTLFNFKKNHTFQSHATLKSRTVDTAHFIYFFIFFWGGLCCLMSLSPFKRLMRLGAGVQRAAD